MHAGLRVPDSAFIRAACRRHGGAVALTSANLSGSESPTRTGDFRGLWPECAGVFDAGEVGTDRSGSTIVDLAAAGRFRVLRRGCAHEGVRRVLQRHGLTEQL
jgi:2',5'-phosphodiesterase